MNNKYIDSLKILDLNFSNKPVKYKTEDYDEVKKKIVKIASQHKDILSIYIFGEVKAPGVSDIDLIFVLKEEAKLPKFLKENFFHKKSTIEIKEEAKGFSIAFQYSKINWNI